MTWLTTSTLGKLLLTFLFSMVPVAELRVGIPYGVSLGLNYWVAALVAVAGNLFPVPAIVLYLRRIFAWLRQKSRHFDAWICVMEDKAENKGEKVKKYGAIGLFLLVAIPLPGTGAWTGALVAAVLGLRLKNALPPIVLGVCAAAIIVLALTFGFSRIF